MNNANSSEINAISTSEMNVLNAGKVNVLASIAMLSETNVKCIAML